MLDRASREYADKPLKITKREARREALVSAASLIDANHFNRFDGDRIDEHDDAAAWAKIDVERHRIVALLCKWAKWSPERLGWEQDR